MLAMVAQTEELHQDAGHDILQSIGRVIMGKTRKRVPHIGECILINETCREYSRIHGGRYDVEYKRRYFGQVAEVYPHIVLLRKPNGTYVSEKRSDFEVGLLRYISLKSLPENENEISYEEKDVESFAILFAKLLRE